MRLNKAIAMLGICSRRTADEFISKGLVKINNVRVKELGIKVNTGDIISVNGFNYTVKNKTDRSVWLYNKPAGLITSHKDDRGRDTVFDSVRDLIGERVISVGRLDINSEGLLLLTNSGEFAHVAEKSDWTRHYRVRVFGHIPETFTENVKKGITIDGIHYAPVEISIQSHAGKHHWCLCILREGKNREIRKIFNNFGLQISRLIRIKYGPYELGNIPVGCVKKVKLLPDFC